MRFNRDITPECELNNTFSKRYENRSDSETAYAKCILESSTCDYRCNTVYVIPPDSTISVTLLGDRRHSIKLQTFNDFEYAEISGTQTNGIFYQTCSSSWQLVGLFD